MSIEEMIETYGDEILRLCLMILGDRQLAEDAFQETFVKSWKRQETFKGESGEKTWLSRIAVNTCRDMLRSGWFRMMRHSQPVEKLLDLQADGDALESFAVRDAVLKLPGRYREVIILYYDQQMKLREIADALHLPINSVSTRLRRARKMLGKALGEELEL